MTLFLAVVVAAAAVVVIVVVTSTVSSLSPSSCERAIPPDANVWNAAAYPNGSGQVLRN